MLIVFGMQQFESTLLVEEMKSPTQSWGKTVKLHVIDELEPVEEFTLFEVRTITVSKRLFNSVQEMLT